MSTPVNLAGRLTGEPELRFSAQGQPIAKFTVVTSRRARNKAGEWEDQDTSFWSVVVFGQMAEHCAESLEKGTAVIVSGRAVQRTWETKEGDKRRSVEVIADDVAPSLRWASAKITKAARSSAPGGSGGSQGTGQGSSGGSREPDPWASGSGGYSDEPPFLREPP